MRDTGRMSTQLAVQEPTVVELNDLAERYDHEHQLVGQSVGAALEHAIACGELLLEAKKRVPGGQWLNWLLERFPDRSYVTHYNYMRLAREADAVREMRPRNLTAALRGLRGTRQPADDRAGQALRDEARALYATGSHTHAEIAAALGVSRASVGYWCNPKSYEASKRKQQLRLKTAQRALHRKNRDDAARKAGGAKGEAYALVRKTLHVLEAAMQGDLTPDVREQLSAAMGSLYNAEDAIVRASKLS